MTTKEWYTSEEIAKICNVSTKTIERKRKVLLEVNPELNWFKTQSKPYKYNHKMMGEFLSVDIYGERKRIRQLERTIDCYNSPDSIPQHLIKLDWNYFVTIAFEESLSKKMCFSIMSELYERIEAYSLNSPTRMFFTTEPFTHRTGHHNHLIIKLDGGTDKRLADLIKKHVPKGRIDIKPYDPYLAGVFYISKQGLEGEDWDLLGNRLKDDAERIDKFKIAA